MSTATATIPTRKSGHPVGNILVGVLNLVGSLFSLLPIIGTVTSCIGFPMMLLGMISSTKDAFFNENASGIHYTGFAINAVACVLFMIGWWVI